MIRQLIFISVFAAAAAMAALAQNVTGTVTCGGAGVSGVAVSDGINVVTTDKQGRYALQTDKANGYVFISIPRGYTVDMADGFSPQFWQKLSDAKVETAEVHNFKLTYSPADNYVMIIGADSHLARRIGDRRTYKKGYIASLKYEKEKATESQLPTYSMILGDLTWDNFWYANKYTLRNFMDDQRKMHYPVPLFPVIGNHDNDPAVPHSANTDFLAAKLWRDVVCPNYYSYNLGKVHYVVLDNIVYQNDTLPAGEKGAQRRVGATQLQCGRHRAANQLAPPRPRPRGQADACGGVLAHPHIQNQSQFQHFRLAPELQGARQLLRRL